MTRFIPGALLALALAGVVHAGVAVEDDSGERLVFDAPVQRIVTLAPHLAELVFEAGAGDRLVGTVEWSDYPAAAQKVPRVGDGFRIDVERIVALQPDVILAWGGGTPETSIQRLRELDLPVAVLTPRDIDSIPQQLQWIGRIAGTEALTGPKARQFRAAVERLKKLYADREPLRVFYQISAQPVFTVGGGHTISDAIELCGGENIFADLAPAAHPVSREAVVTRDPDVIIGGHYVGSAEELSGWRRWENLAAVRAGNLFAIDAERIARPALRFIDGLQELCETLETARRNKVASET